MKNQFLFILTLLGSLCVGQSLYVKDSLTQNPIAEVEILDSNENIIGYTDYSGKIQINESFRDFLFLTDSDYQVKKIDLTNHLIC